MNIDLKVMSIEELNLLANSIKLEIESRTKTDKPALILYTHNCKGESQSHKNKKKHWAKIVTSVDVSKTNGYAFAGEFLDINREHKVPYGCIVVEVCGYTIYAYKMDSNMYEVASGNTQAMSAFIEKVATLV